MGMHFGCFFFFWRRVELAVSNADLYPVVLVNYSVVDESRRNDFEANAGRWESAIFCWAEDHKKKRNQYSTSILDKQTILQPSGEGSVDIHWFLLILILLHFIFILAIQGTGIQSRYLIWTCTCPAVIDKVKSCTETKFLDTDWLLIFVYL